MSRQVPWRRICPDVVCHRIEQANQARIYLLRETGPTGFLLKEDGNDKKFKVFLGDQHSCTCSTFMKERELCIHILWVLLKKFRVPKENAVIFQLSLVEREINEVIRGAYHQSHTRRKDESQNNVNPSDNRNKLKQKEITDEDICPICQDELLMKSGEPLTYCKYGCGNSIHIKCMKVWAEHQRSTGEKIMKCPLCRVDFGSFQEIQDEFTKSSRKKTRSERQDVHLGATCHKCKMSPISGKCYRCAVCIDYHLCHQCFASDHHVQHSFQFRQNSSHRWRPASRVTPLPNAVMENLQAREITDADYDLLLQLDRALADHEGVPGHVLTTLPVEVLRDRHPLITSNTICQVCLSSFQPFHCVRKLACHHAFHRDCIDNWLTSHSTCPVDGGTVNAVLPNQRGGSNEVRSPLTRKDRSNRQGLLVKRRERGSTENSQIPRSLPSDFSLSGLGIVVRDRSRESSPSEKIRNSNHIDCSPPQSLLLRNQSVQREHIIFDPLNGSKPPIAPTGSRDRGVQPPVVPSNMGRGARTSSYSSSSSKRKNSIGNQVAVRRCSLPLEQKTSKRYKTFTRF
ncbi:E3 ubiquitin-protein ligase ZSWIM2-like isoform X2 [Actinia tenebrosa]|uniref:E3 ubiquitin-protein ligase ZSWIM2-like isoform X2 n=1 Tax=Actinia tenebrosa TaxID=6105 RepID=A0A6P8IWH6_ACTTE|nr:E3 ubiquitin-protein ligase ZSWIM2-like isoform X2 [Actinia tenebrosa]